jgi:hypothetical protein
MIHGSCQCQAIAFEYDGAETDFGVITFCHCSDCRKLQGSTGVIAAPLASARLTWTRGHDRITEFESSPGKKRAFCNACGTPLYSRRDDRPEVLRLRIGCIDTPLAITPQAHIFSEDLPAWADLDAAYPRYPRQEPGRG